MDQYDAIVIGCNINSLISALRLLNSNKKVLLIDKKNTIGELVSNSKIGRYTINYDIHHLYLKNNTFNYSLNKILNACNIEERINFKNIDNICTIKIREKEYILPFGIETFINYLDNEFNGSKESLNKLFSLARIVREVYDNVYSDKIDFNNLDKEFIKIIGMSLDKGLDYLKFNDDVKELLIKLCILFGTESNNLSFIDYLLFLINIVERGIQVTNTNLLKLLLYEFIKQGGFLRLNSKVVNLIIDDNIINGIRLDNGEVIYTTNVITGIKMSTIYGDLISSSEVPRIALKHINKREDGYKVFSIHLVLNKDVSHLGIKNYINIINDNMIVYGDNNILSIHYILKDNVFIESINNKNYYFAIDRMTKKILDELDIDLYNYIEEIKVINPFINKHVFDYKININDSWIVKELNRNNERYIKGLYVCEGLNGDIFGYNSSIMSGSDIVNYFKDEGDNNE